MKLGNKHLAYCTNIHPAESWEETFTALKEHTLTVRDKLVQQRLLDSDAKYAIGLRLSALAAEELSQQNTLADFKTWLDQEKCYVFTINGFPYGAFHDTRVKENVYKPDWTTQERLTFTNRLIDIIADLCPPETGGSVSTLPGSFKEFKADEKQIFKNLYAHAKHISKVSKEKGKDLHLGLEPEPLGHFENTEETLEFFSKLHAWATANKLDTAILRKHIGVNYDTCHFALEFNDCYESLNKFKQAKIRISKIHLSNALEIDPSQQEALDAIKSFDEPTYLHQFMLKQSDGSILRFRDLPEFFASETDIKAPASARIHFHIPLYFQPSPPLSSTHHHAEDALHYLEENPDCCTHLEMETYTWGVLPDNMQKPITDQLVEEYLWTLNQA